MKNDILRKKKEDKRKKKAKKEDEILKGKKQEEEEEEEQEEEEEKEEEERKKATKTFEGRGPGRKKDPKPCKTARKWPFLSLTKPYNKNPKSLLSNNVLLN